MKVIIIGTAYPMRGGIAHYNSLLLKYLSEKHDAKIYSFRKQYPEFLFPGKTQFETGKSPVEIPIGKNIITVNSINLFNWLSSGLKIRKEYPDLVIIKYWMPFFAPCFFTISLIAKLFRKTKILYICDNIIPHEKRFGDMFLTRLAFSTADYFIVQSSVVEKNLLKMKTNKPYKLSPHPLYNLFGDQISKSEAREFLEKNYNIDFNTEKVLLFFGYIRKYKGLLNLIDAMSIVLEKMNVKLIVAGEFYENSEPYFDKIKSLDIEKNISIISEFIPDSNVRYFFSACDAVVLPYISATQSGIVQIAYFYDKPAIVTNVGGLSEVVKNGETGFVVCPDNTPELAESVIKFYTGYLEEKFRENIKKEKSKYDWENFIKNIEELINIKN